MTTLFFSPFFHDTQQVSWEKSGKNKFSWSFHQIKPINQGFTETQDTPSVPTSGVPYLGKTPPGALPYTNFVYSRNVILKGQIPYAIEARLPT